MKLSTKGRYGLRALIDLALFSELGHVPLSKIAERQDLSEIYLEQVFAALRKGAIVKSIKGAQGGYLLAMPLSRITVGLVLRVLEGDLSVFDGEDRIQPNSVAEVIKEKVWDQMDEAIDQLVDNVTLEDLVNQHKKMNNTEVLMYYI